MSDEQSDWLGVIFLAVFIFVLSGVLQWLG